MDGRANHPISGRLIVGLVLAALGVLWTLDNLGLMNASEITRWWPLLLVAVGVMKLTGIGMERQTGLGVFLTALGGLFLLGAVDFVHVDLSILLPLFFIFIGFQIAARAMRGPRDAGGTGPGTDTDDFVRSFAFMAGITRVNASQAFRGGDLSAVMGGIQLDLDQAKPAGGRAVLDVFAVWGGIEIRVPENWRVELEATPVMAGVDSSARLAPGVEPVGTLVVRGFVMMGGVDVKNAPLGDMRAGVVMGTRRTGRHVRIEEEDEHGRVVRKDVRIGPTGIEVKREYERPGGQPPVEPE